MVTGWLQEQTCAFPSRFAIFIQYSNHVGNLRVLCMHRTRILSILHLLLALMFVRWCSVVLCFTLYMITQSVKLSTLSWFGFVECAAVAAHGHHSNDLYGAA